jgi:hypothetical protein
MYPFRVLERELGRDRRAARVAGDVRASDAQVREQGRRVGRVVGHADRRRRMGAARPTPLVIANELVALGQRGFAHERHEPVRQDGADQQHGFAEPGHLEFELDTIDLGSFHGSSSGGCGIPAPTREA